MLSCVVYHSKTSLNKRKKKCIPEYRAEFLCSEKVTFKDSLKYVNKA